MLGPEIIGRDLAYKIARQHGIRIGRRLLIPVRVAEALIDGRLEELVTEKTSSDARRGREGLQ
ncbi:hypothetical protein CSW25_04545 [Thermus scotoductus]|uniref:Uncharacterized protein n=1 Tax=Thermus scotoductus TaxID=37636 RepID=A0A430SCK9_THESC|nr:hypothetical protein CSW48_04375 [Thermus scotoductus]RTH11682.1 hypothetical protein CSW46_03935 [Thermus scotoductus]RTH12592.1 hypothetical protein CSW44_03575 [Thermus scotoductus]RTH13426.1 hypothetical protein CSW43_03765 [Thermus scotoductus]RTH18465.1 hypothetical protein CSW39_05080 [Thermus scotoductus]